MPEATRRRFTSTASNAGAARAFLRDSLADEPTELVETAETVLGELVANAILHTGTDFEVSVARLPDGRIRVEVTDEAPHRALIARYDDPDAATGRGLRIVEALADSYGMEAGELTKTIWFEMGQLPSIPRDTSTWEGPSRATGRSVAVELIGFPVGLSRAAQRHRAALLREGRLALLTGAPGLGVTLEEIERATDLNDILDEELNAAHAALRPNQSNARFTLTIPTVAAARAESLRRLLEKLNQLARDGVFLTRPALPEIVRYRAWLLGEVGGQLDGDPPRPWDPSTSAISEGPILGQGLEWDMDRVTRAEAPTLAADDDNRIIGLNEAAGELLHWDPEDLVGRRIVNLIPPTWRDRHVAAFTNFLLTGEGHILGTPVRVPALRQDGSTVVVDLLVTVEYSHVGRMIFYAELRPADVLAGATV